MSHTMTTKIKQHKLILYQNHSILKGTIAQQKTTTISHIFTAVNNNPTSLQNKQKRHALRNGIHITCANKNGGRNDVNSAQ